jgi:two-component system sensor histidine kinase KdpD
MADIEVESERLGRMIEDLLLLSRVEVGKTVATEPLLVQRVLEQTAKAFLQRYPDRPLEVTTEPPDLAALGDPVYMDQVLRNVLTNAAKYSPAGSEIDIRAERMGDEVVISVMDRGPGVPEEELERIFERFYRREETSRYQRGAGLGLTVCRRLMEAQCGRVWAEQRPGGGLIIRLALEAVELEAGG